MRHLVNDVELLNGQLVDLVEHVYARHVAAVALNHVDQLVDGRIAAAKHIRGVDFVFAANGVHDLVGQHGLRHHRLEVDGTFVLASGSV